MLNPLTKIAEILANLIVSHKESDAIAVFFGGGFLAAVKIPQLDFISIFQTDQFLDFTVRAILGGFIAISTKFLGEVLITWFKKFRKSKNKPNENNNE